MPKLVVMESTADFFRETASSQIMFQTAKKKRRRSQTRFLSTPDWSTRLSSTSWSLLLTDCLIAALLLIFPFIMGGREAWGHRVLISLALLLGLAWSIHKFRTGGRFVILSLEPLLIAGLFLVWYQTIPQTPEVLGQMSAEYERLLPGWGPTQTVLQSEEDVLSAKTWQTLSLTPTETKHAFWVLLAYGVVGLVITQRIQSLRDCELLLKLAALSGVLMAVFAVVQLVASNDRFFWFYRHPFTGTREVLKGAFTNRNHFAQFLSISIGPLIWWTLSERKNHQQRSASTVRLGLGPAQGSHSNFDNLISVRMLLLLCALAGVIMCSVLSLSRGGMAASVIAVGVSCIGLLQNAQARKSLSLGLPVIGFLVVMGLLFIGGENVDVRVNQLASGDVNKMDTGNARRTIWKADLEATSRFPFFGTGVGSHREVYPIYMVEFADFSTYEFTHAESTYVNLLLETGIAGFVLLVLGLVAILSRLIWRLIRPQDADQAVAVAAVLASLLAGTVHATADFIWYAPAIVVTTIVLAVIGLRICGGFGSERGLTMPRFVWLGTAAACVLTFFSVQPGLAQRVTGEKYWHQYLIATLDEQRNVAEAAARMQVTEEIEELQATEAVIDPDLVSSGYHESDDDDDDAKNKSLQRRAGLLLKSLNAFPDQPRVQLRLATICLQLFDDLQQDSGNNMSLAQIRDTVRSSEFQSRAAMYEWLNRAFGRSIKLPLLADKMARKSLAGCPVQGNAYLLLAETEFLADPASLSSQLMIDQALLVRGYDPKTRFIAGQELLITGRQTEAIEQWSTVFHANSMYRRSITSVFSRMVPPAFVMEQFSPGLLELADVLDIYRQATRPYDLRPIFVAIQEQMDADSDQISDEARIRLLMDANDIAMQRELFEFCEIFLTKAIALDEHAYRPRRALGMLHLQQEKYAEAVKHLLWCYDQQPGDSQLGYLIAEARKRDMKSQMEAAPAVYSGSSDGHIHQSSQSTNLPVQ